MSKEEWFKRKKRKSELDDSRYERQRKHYEENFKFKDASKIWISDNDFEYSLITPIFANLIRKNQNFLYSLYKREKIEKRVLYHHYKCFLLCNVAYEVDNFIQYLFEYKKLLIYILTQHKCESHVYNTVLNEINEVNTQKNNSFFWETLL